jgi:hypothetical protein
MFEGDSLKPTPLTVTGRHSPKAIFSLATGETNEKEALPVVMVCVAFVPRAVAVIRSLPILDGVYLIVAVPVVSVRTDAGTGFPRLELSVTVAPETVFPAASFTPTVSVVGVPRIAEEAPLKVTVVPDTTIEFVAEAPPDLAVSVTVRFDLSPFVLKVTETVPVLSVVPVLADSVPEDAAIVTGAPSIPPLLASFTTA